MSSQAQNQSIEDASNRQVQIECDNRVQSGTSAEQQAVPGKEKTTATIVVKTQ